jgi:glutaredoxin-related protein
MSTSQHNKLMLSMNECQRIVKANDTWGSLDDVESDGDIGCPRRDILAHT